MEGVQSGGRVSQEGAARGGSVPGREAGVGNITASPPRPSFPAPSPPPTDPLQAAPGAAAAAAAGCGLREPGLDAPPHPGAPEALPSPGGAEGPMEVRDGHPWQLPHPPGLREGLEVTGGDGQGLGGDQTWRMATARRG